MAVKSIDKETCIGCGTCVVTCPMDVFRLDVDGGEEVSPCSKECPLGVRHREYHNLLKLDQIDEAALSLREYHPMPVITGRICPHGCEKVCSRNNFDDPVNINGIEQYLGDHLLQLGEVETAEENGKKVAIIGSGPAGLSAAYFLRKLGYGVTVFEKDKTSGGALADVIPSFRLPVSVLEGQIAYYEKMGITFKNNTTVGKDISIEELKSQGYQACIAAVGALKPFALNVAGSDSQGITTAMDYLRSVKFGKITKETGSVAVIGGGSVALDSARSAIRLGAKEVHLFCLEVLEEGHKDCMVAPREEINDAIAEGVVIHPSRSVESFVVEGGAVKGLKLVECTSVRGTDGAFNPQYGKDILPENYSVDTVVLAIGQGADKDLVPQGFQTTDRGYIVADKKSNQVDGFLFAAGDIVTGPTVVVKAAASGKRAALAVDNFIRGEELTKGLDLPVKEFVVKDYELMFKSDRNDRETVPAEEAKTNFDGTVKSFTWYQAQMEANRCLTCGSRSTIGYVADCQACSLCANYCPTAALTVCPGHVPNILHAWDVNNLGKGTV